MVSESEDDEHSMILGIAECLRGEIVLQMQMLMRDAIVAQTFPPFFYAALLRDEP